MICPTILSMHKMMVNCSLSILEFEQHDHSFWLIHPTFPKIRLHQRLFSCKCDLRTEPTVRRVINMTATDGEHFADVMSVEITLVESAYR